MNSEMVDGEIHCLSNQSVKHRSKSLEVKSN